MSADNKTGGWFTTKELVCWSRHMAIICWHKAEQKLFVQSTLKFVV